MIILCYCRDNAKARMSQLLAIYSEIENCDVKSKWLKIETECKNQFTTRDTAFAIP